MHFVQAFYCAAIVSLLAWLCPNLHTPTYSEQLAQGKVLQTEGYKEIVRRQLIKENRTLAKSLQPGDIVRLNWKDTQVDVIDNDRLWLVTSRNNNLFGSMLHSFGCYRELNVHNDEMVLAITEVVRWGSPKYTYTLQMMANETIVRCQGHHVPVGPLLP